MEAVIQTKGLLSLPSNSKTRYFRYFYPSLGLKSRFNCKNNRAFGGLSLSLYKNQKARESNGFASETPGHWKKQRKLQICRAEAAAGAAADGQAYLKDLEKPKFLGVEVFI